MPGCRSNDPNGGSEHDCWVYPNLSNLNPSKLPSKALRLTQSQIADLMA